MPPNSRADPVRRQAQDWLIRKHSGAWSPGDQRALEIWLDADPRHREEYGKAGRLWQRLQTFEPHVSAQRVAARRFRKHDTQHRPAALIRGSIAFGVILAIGVASYHGWQTRTIAYATERGQRLAITLADGSSAILNTDTVIKVQFTATGRLVTLARGEALFTVAHDAERAFEVVAGPGRIRDIGTRFDVSEQAGRISVAVLDGAVAVTTDRDARGATLTTGQAVSFAQDGSLSDVYAADVAAIRGWETGKLLFRDQPLEEVLAQIMRYHPVRFTLADPGLKAIRVSGSFMTDNLPLFLATLQAGFPIQAEVIDRGHIRLQRARRRKP
jgi:transmembrane sensor